MKTEASGAKPIKPTNGGRVLSFLVSLVLILALLSFGRLPTAGATKIRVPLDFATIQEAINNASNGDLIEVSPLVYPEHLEVNKTVILSGTNPDSVIIDGNGSGTVVHIKSSDVDMSGFTIQNGNTGLSISNTSSNNVIRFNKITNCDDAVHIEYSTGNTFSHNNMTANLHHFVVDGDTLQDFLQIVDDSNTINGNPMYYWVNQADGATPPGAVYVALVNCRNITVQSMRPSPLSGMQTIRDELLVAYSTDIKIKNLDLGYRDEVSFMSTNNSRAENVSVNLMSGGFNLFESASNLLERITALGSGGINLHSSDNNVIRDSVLQSSGMIALWESNNNSIYGNTLQGPSSGMMLMNCTGNVIYHNNIIDNIWPAYSDETGNYWDNGREGNYWSGCVMVDENRDGINDTAYKYLLMTYESDRFPLVEMWAGPLRAYDVGQAAKMSYPLSNRFIYVWSPHVLAWINLTAQWWNKSLCVGMVALTFNSTSNSPESCSVTIPRDMIDGPFSIYYDGEELEENTDYTTTTNATHSTLSINYGQDAHMIEIHGYALRIIYADVDRDGKITMGDINAVLDNFGKHYP